MPPVPKDLLIEQEDKLTGEAYLRQLMSTYGLTLPPEQVQPFVDIRECMKGSAEWPRWVRSFVSSYYAIWSQPVVHELPLVDKSVLFMVGTRDRTAPGRAFAKPEDRDRMGQVAERARDLAPRMRNARVETFEDVGHLPPSGSDRALPCRPAALPGRVDLQTGAGCTGRDVQEAQQTGPSPSPTLGSRALRYSLVGMAVE